MNLPLLSSFLLLLSRSRAIVRTTRACGEKETSPRGTKRLIDDDAAARRASYPQSNTCSLGTSDIYREKALPPFSPFLTCETLLESHPANRYTVRESRAAGHGECG